MLVITEMTGPFIMAKPWSVVDKTSIEEFSQLSVLLTRKLRNWNTLSDIAVVYNHANNPPCSVLS